MAKTHWAEELPTEYNDPSEPANSNDLLMMNTQISNIRTTCQIGSFCNENETLNIFVVSREQVCREYTLKKTLYLYKFCCVFPNN